MNVLVLDAGNAVIKAKTATREFSYPHALVQLTETQYHDVTVRAGRAGAPADYVVINGKAYAIGESAERFPNVSRLEGAARYRRDYYGVFVAATLGRVYDRGGDVAIFGSHAPRDVQYRDNLMDSALGEWTVEVGGTELTFNVVYANTFDEPQGGLMNVLLTESGKKYARNDINGGRSLVVDVGGHTTDWLAVNPGGEVDYSLNESTPIGILRVLKDFEQSFRAAHKDQLQDASGSLPAMRIRDALRTGVFSGGGFDVDCQREVKEASNVLLNRLADTYRTIAGGGIDFDSIILTGGGAGLLGNQIKAVLKHPHIFLADEAECIHLANVRGGLKYWRLLEALDLL